MRPQILPESSPSPWPVTRTGMMAGITSGLFFPVVSICERYSEESSPLGLLPVAAMILAVLLLLAASSHYWWRWIRGLDEMQRLIQLKAFAAVFPVIIGIMVGNDLLRHSGLANGWQWDALEVAMVMAAIYWVAFLWFWWRNR